MRSRVDFSAWAEFADEASTGYARCEALVRSRRGEVILTQKLPDKVFLRDDIYNDFLRPLGTRYLMGLKLAESGSKVAMLRIHRRAKNGPYSSADARKLSLLFPSFSRTARVYLNQFHMTQPGAVAVAALDQLKIGAIVIDRGQRVLHANAFAQDVLAEGASLYTQDGRLMLSCAEANAALRYSIGKACRTRRDALESAALGLQRVWASDYELSISPFANDGSTLPHCAASEAWLVTLKRRKRQSNNMIAALRNDFGLTAAEASVVEHITQGKTLQQIAAQNSISINTVKTHLKAIYVKMDVRSQADLVRTILASQYSAS